MNPSSRPLGLYLHIPFCKSKCAYCDFYSLAGTEADMDAYTLALCRHLRDFAPRIAGYSVDTVYFGGGTPSWLGTEHLLRIWETVQRSYSIASGAEITLEANPDSAGDWLSDLRGAGFNRISMGMQSADDRELESVGRVHRTAQTRAAVETVRRAGFANLSLDLIYGLPGQSLASWQNSVRTAAGLSPEHLSCYGLKLEPGTPLYRRRDILPLPDDEEQADQYLWAVEFLDGAGYRQYEISNFSRPGRESRHNLKYWTLGEYLGFGPGAHSDFGGRRFAWARDLGAYVSACQADRESCQADRETRQSGTGTCQSDRGIRQSDTEHLQFDGGTGTIPLSENRAISPKEREREWVMLCIRTARGLEEAECRERFGHGLDCISPFLEQCQKAGYAVRRESGGGIGWRLTPRGFLVSNRIIGELLDLL